MYLFSRTETSSRNSEVIHAGIYYPPSSLKSKLCVHGKELLYNFCNSRDIPHDRKGKLIVATNKSQFQFDLPKILDNAIRNGVDDVRLISDYDVKHHFESQVVCHGALFSPSTGVVDSHSLMVSLLADAENHGATLALNSKVDNISLTVDGKLGIEAEGMELVCESVVNCAGLKASDIAQMVFQSAQCTDLSTNRKRNRNRNRNGNGNGNGNEMNRQLLDHRQYFAKGNYYRLQGQRTPFQHLVYPVPEKGGLGVHATIDLAGNTRFGPDVEWISQDVIDADEIDLSVDPNRSKCFYGEVRKYWPGLEDGSLVPDYCGIRPKLGHPMEMDGPSIKADFKIEGEKDHGIKGFVNLQGIESPGLTSSLAIAERVKHMLVH